MSTKKRFHSMMKNTSLLNKIVLFFILGISGISTTYAQAIATVSKNQLTENEVIQLMISVDKSASQGDFDLSQLGDDFYTGQVSFGSSRSLVNGDYSVHSQWNLSIAPTKLGTLIIPSLDIAGEKTNVISIRVSKNVNAPKSSDIIKISGELTKEELYESETALFHAKMVIFSDIRRLKDPKITSPKGKNIELTPINESKQYQTVIDGLQATVIEQSFSVSSNHIGTLTLNGLGFSGSLIQADRYGRSTNMIPLTLDIQPKQYQLTILPKPAEITGTWLPTSRLTLGQKWLIDGQPLTEATLEAGTAITREITLMMADVPPEKLPKINIDYPNSVRMYDEKPVIGTNSQGNSVVTIKQVIIPHTSGSITLPSVSIPWWNSNTREKETAKLDHLQLEITPNSQISEQKIDIQTNAQPYQKINRDIDHGFWLYTTLVFALLWILTAIGWFISHTTKSVKENSIMRKPIMNTNALISALDNNQFILAHQLLSDQQKTWMEQGINVSKIQALVTTLSKSIYAETTDKKSKKQVMGEIKKQLKPIRASVKANIDLERL